MPLEYSGITAEHMAVRTSAGLFDVSHMGEIEIAGKDALVALQRISCNDASKLQPGQAQYSGLLTPSGTFVDDLVVYRLKADHFLLVVNAANLFKDYAWIAEHIASAGDAVAVDSSSRYALLAVQGPAAAGAVQPLTGVDLSSLAHFSFAHGEVANVRATISRTGYTGEDGFEIFVPPQSADRVWQAVLASGEADGLVPCGLGARDTLRLEAAMRLYGNDIDEETTALEAGLGWIVGWQKPDFVGAAALRAQKAAGLSRKTRGFRAGRSRNRPPRARGAGRRRQGGHGDQRHADAVPEESDRHGLSCRPTRRCQAPGSRSTFAAARRARASCRCRFTNARRNRRAIDDGVSVWVQIHERTRVDRHHRRPRPRRHHGLRAAAARRRRLHRAAGGGHRAERRAVVRHDRVREGGVRALLTGVGRGRRGQRRAEEQARGCQRRPSRQLADRRQAVRTERSRRPARRRAVPAAS